MLKPDDIVTVEFKNSLASNTFKVHSIHGEDVYLTHPLYPACLISKKLNELNKESARLKDSTERSLDFAQNHKNILDYNKEADLDALCLYFVITRKLTPKQKQILSGICGLIASVKFDNDVKQAMAYIIKNEALLDDFNRMWYVNFKNLFSGKQPITSKQQRSAIFNIAGFVLAESTNPITNK